MKNCLYLLNNGDLLQGKVLHDWEDCIYLSNVVIYRQNGAYSIEKRSCYILSKKKLAKDVNLTDN